MGWEEYDSSRHDIEDVNLFYQKRLKLKDISRLLCPNSLQKTNHFPMTNYLCVKDSLCRMLKKQRALYGNVFNFVPLTFILPNDYSKFIDVFGHKCESNTSKYNGDML